MKNPQDFFECAELDTIVVVPVLNESNHIRRIISALRADRGAARRSELWVVDGGSDDDTVRIAMEYARRDSGVRVLYNADRIQASAVNLAAREAAKRGGIRYLVRADAHAGYPPAWVSRLVATAEEEGADSVVVPMATRGCGAFGRASADLFNSWLGNGGAPHRSGSRRGYVGHGHHALWRLDAFTEAGGYDPDFRANEDAELDMRLRQGGRTIFLENRATITYYPRETLRDVCRQFFRNGRYRVRTSIKHRTPLQLRQLTPIGLVGGLAVSMLAGAFIHPAFLGPVALYLAAVLVAACAIAGRKSITHVGLMVITAVTAHVAFGLGALCSLAGRAITPGPVAGSNATTAKA